RDARRLVRALEVHAATGQPPSALRERASWQATTTRYPARIVCLEGGERAALYRRIDARVLAMVEAGLVAEVAGLAARGVRPPLRAQQAIGYAEIHRHLDGELGLAAAVALVQRNSRRYARRQLSWYRRDPRVERHAGAANVDLAALCRYLRQP